jgi:hypothetical protein
MMGAAKRGSALLMVLIMTTAVSSVGLVVLHILLQLNQVVVDRLQNMNYYYQARILAHHAHMQLIKSPEILPQQGRREIFHGAVTVENEKLIEGQVFGERKGSCWELTTTVCDESGKTRYQLMTYTSTV